MTLVRSVSVLQLHDGRDAEDIGNVTFWHPGQNDAPEDQSPRNERLLIMSKEDWNDLGHPTLITVAIFPDNVIDQLPEVGT